MKGISIMIYLVEHDTTEKFYFSSMTNGAKDGKSVFDKCRSILEQSIKDPNAGTPQFPSLSADSLVKDCRFKRTDLFCRMLGKSIYGDTTPTLKDTRILAELITINGKPYPFRGDQITDKNFTLVQNDIALLTTMAISGKEDFPKIGLCAAPTRDRKLDSIELKAQKSAYPPVPSLLKEQPPAKPGIFKRILNTLFGAFKEDIDNYNRAISPFNDAKANYQKEIESLEKNLRGNSEAGEKYAKENSAELTRNIEQLRRGDTVRMNVDSLQREEGIAPKERVTEAVKNDPELSKAKEK